WCSPASRRRAERVTTRARYRGGNYRRRSVGSQVILYATVTAVALWLIAPFVWLFVTSVSYQRNLLARPFTLVPPEVTLDNYRKILGLVRFHAEGQAGKILASMWNSLVVALVDGCNRFQAYWRVVLPVSGPGLVAGGAFTFMLCWNEFVVAQILNTKPGTTTLPPVIAGMNGQINIDYSVIAASGFLGALPAVLLVLVFQKYMVQGLTAGSVKG